MDWGGVVMGSVRAGKTLKTMFCNKAQEDILQKSLFNHDNFSLNFHSFFLRKQLTLTTSKRMPVPTNKIKTARQKQNCVRTQSGCDQVKSETGEI